MIETKPVPVDHLAIPVAEPMDGGFYAPPSNPIDETPTPEDIGPVQKNFALASQVDTRRGRDESAHGQQ